MPGGDSQSFGYRLLRLDADDAIDELAVFEDKQGRYARDSKTSRYLRVLVHVQLSYPVTSLRFCGELIQRGADHPAWTAPGRPAINENWSSFGLHYFLFESLIGNDEWFCIMLSGNGLQSLSTATAHCLARRQSAFLDTVLRSTLFANNYLHSNGI